MMPAISVDRVIAAAACAASSASTTPSACALCKSQVCSLERDASSVSHKLIRDRYIPPQVGNVKAVECGSAVML